MPQTVRDFIFFVLPWTIFIPLVISLLRFRGNPLSLKAITFYLGVSAATQVIGFTLWKQHKNNLPLLHAYTLLEYACIVYFYSLVLAKYIARKYFILLFAGFTLFAIADSFFIENIFTYNTYSRTVEALIIIFLSVLWFIKAVSDTSINFSSVPHIIYINSGFLLYFSSSIALFSLNKYIHDLALTMRLNVWTINSIVTAILYLFITIGLWIHPKD